MKASLMLCLLFNFLHHLLKVFLPGGFENLLAILFPLLEIAKADAQLVRIFSLRQTEFRSDRLDLLTLTFPKKQIIVIQQRFHRHLKKLRDFFHVLWRIEVFAVFFIVDIGASVYPGVVCNVSLP